MTTTTIISKEQFNNEIKDRVGSLLFPSDLYDMLHYFDMKQLRKYFNVTGRSKKICKLLVQTCPEKNIANKDITFKYDLRACSGINGAFFKDGEWLYRHPVGDMIIVIS